MFSDDEDDDMTTMFTPIMELETSEDEEENPQTGNIQSGNLVPPAESLKALLFVILVLYFVMSSIYICFE